jgi:hypothetical protein
MKSQDQLDGFWLNLVSTSAIRGHHFLLSRVRSTVCIKSLVIVKRIYFTILMVYALQPPLPNTKKKSGFWNSVSMCTSLVPEWLNLVFKSSSFIGSWPVNMKVVALKIAPPVGIPNTKLLFS